MQINNLLNCYQYLLVSIFLFLGSDFVHASTSTDIYQSDLLVFYQPQQQLDGIEPLSREQFSQYSTPWPTQLQQLTEKDLAPIALFHFEFSTADKQPKLFCLPELNQQVSDTLICPGWTIALTWKQQQFLHVRMQLFHQANSSDVQSAPLAPQSLIDQWLKAFPLQQWMYWDNPQIGIGLHFYKMDQAVVHFPSWEGK